MYKEDIKDRMTKSFKYDDRDNSKNMLILNDWLYTKDGFNRYRKITIIAPPVAQNGQRGFFYEE
jgi:hypothetical protein